MDIAIIGAGNVGSALASSFVTAGHAVRISSSDPDDAHGVAEETGADPAGSNQEGVEGAELVVLAVPAQAVDAVVDEIADRLSGKVVIDVTNRLDPDDPARFLDGTSVAERIQSRLPGAAVVKAFNTVFAANQADPEVEGTPSDGFVAGDDEEAKRKVLELVDSVGMRPLDVGPLAMARALEGMGTINILLNMRNGWVWQTAWKLVGPTTG